jgi:tRNA(fMet)-specific endonuclease VapC
MTHLDTSTVVAYLRGDGRVAKKLHSVLPDVRISTVVLAELLFGARVSARPDENLRRIMSFAQVSPPIAFDEACAAAYANIKAHLRRIGKPTGEADALIAATALMHDATLVTHNKGHYENVPDLRLDDWLL